MKLSAPELRMLRLCLQRTMREDEATLHSLDPDSDAHAELGNDLMLMDALVSKLEHALKASYQGR
ncbi:hypothetical protein [Gallaecimonas pentaromativorans]|uniref:hypothetical protein n=1 Tax=Gallaecimonas pentaromativorans TaxID=584787 RepID=UPI003A920AE5